jgi:hypothetical protein
MAFVTAKPAISTVLKPAPGQTSYHRESLLLLIWEIVV